MEKKMDPSEFDKYPALDEWLKAYKESKRIYPVEWKLFFDYLIDIGAPVPKPLILAGSGASNKSKRDRFCIQVEIAKTYVGGIATYDAIKATIKTWNIGDPNDAKTLHDFPLT